MAYVKIVYQNSPSTATPLNAENLNHMDDQIALNDQRLTEIETSYVKSFNGRKGEVTPQSGDYNIGQITPLTGAQVGQVPVVVNHGTEEDPELVFEMGTGGGGGHSIIDSEGNTMPQEDAMQFADSFVSDDPTNGKTVVENIKEVASADYSSETEDGMYLIPDGEGAVIEPASDDKVEVVADGVKTYATLLNEIADNTDFSKVIDSAYLTSESVSGAKNVFVLRAHSNSYATFFHGTSENAGSKIRTYHITPNGSLYEESVGTSYSDKSTDKPSNGTKITLHYGNKKATVDLQTTANRCLYDSNTTVKQKIDGLIKSMSMSATSNSDGVIETSLPTSTLVCTYRFGNYLLSPFTSGGVWKFAVCDIDSNTRAVKAVRNATGTLYVYYIDL